MIQAVTAIARMRMMRQIRAIVPALANALKMPKGKKSGSMPLA